MFRGREYFISHAKKPSDSGYASTAACNVSRPPSASDTGNRTGRIHLPHEDCPRSSQNNSQVSSVSAEKVPSMGNHFAGMHEGGWRNIFKSILSSEKRHNEQHDTTSVPKYGSDSHIKQTSPHKDIVRSTWTGDGIESRLPKHLSEQYNEGIPRRDPDDSRRHLILARNVHFGPSEVREFSPYINRPLLCHSTSDAASVIYKKGNTEAQKNEAEVDVKSNGNILFQLDAAVLDEGTSDGIPVFFRHDVTDLNQRFVNVSVESMTDLKNTDSPSTVPKCQTEYERPDGGSKNISKDDCASGLSIDQAITFGHGQYVSRHPPLLRQGSSTLEEFLKTAAESSSPGNAEEIFLGWCS